MFHHKISLIEYVDVVNKYPCLKLDVHSSNFLPNFMKTCWAIQSYLVPNPLPLPRVVTGKIVAEIRLPIAMGLYGP